MPGREGGNDSSGARENIDELFFFFFRRGS